MVNIITAVLVIVSVKVTAIRNLQLLTSQAIHLLPALDIATLTIDNTGIYLSTHDTHVNPWHRTVATDNDDITLPFTAPVISRTIWGLGSDRKLAKQKTQQKPLSRWSANILLALLSNWQFEATKAVCRCSRLLRGKKLAARWEQAKWDIPFCGKTWLESGWGDGDLPLILLSLGRDLGEKIGPKIETCNCEKKRKAFERG